jgi:hypothetical protein
MMPSIRELQRRNVVTELNAVLDCLASWCPHGDDSGRTGDYGVAQAIRERIEVCVGLMGQHGKEESG